MTSSLGGVQVLNKANSLLQVLATRGPQTAVELARETGEPRTTIYRLLATLQPMGWVEETPRRGRYALGLQLVQLGRAAVEQELERRVALPALRALRNETGLTVYLTVLRGLRAVCVERIDGREVLAFGCSSAARCRYMPVQARTSCSPSPTPRRGNGGATRCVNAARRSR